MDSRVCETRAAAVRHSARLLQSRHVVQQCAERAATTCAAAAHRSADKAPPELRWRACKTRTLSHVGSSLSYAKAWCVSMLTSFAVRTHIVGVSQPDAALCACSQERLERMESCGGAPPALSRELEHKSVELSAVAAQMERALRQLVLHDASGAKRDLWKVRNCACLLSSIFSELS